MRFKIYDRVECIIPFNRNRFIAGKVGTVVSTITDGKYGVIFDDNASPITSAVIKHPDRYGCWWCGEDILRPIHQNKADDLLNIIEVINNGAK